MTNPLTILDTLQKTDEETISFIRNSDQDFFNKQLQVAPGEKFLRSELKLALRSTLLVSNTIVNGIETCRGILLE